MPNFASYHPTSEKDLELMIQNAEPIIQNIDRVCASLSCSQCHTPLPKKCTDTRKIWDFGDERKKQQVQIHLRFSRHYCPQCRKYTCVDTSDIAPPGAHYTHRVIDHAIRLVVEDNISYRNSSWNLWRDHAVFAPFATIQNWVEATGKKGGSRRRPAGVPG